MSAWAGRTFDGPDPKRPSAGSRSGAIGTVSMAPDPATSARAIRRRLAGRATRPVPPALAKGAARTHPVATFALTLATERARQA
ncbi:hypothetical protein GCM10023169_03180 [Georgenia halophila]|uniref:Uncharacterized protein n=1 Tax=Georgenia halophila TaxID=620889 RepID=A0ABP8KUG0_9MICO